MSAVKAATSGDFASKYVDDKVDTSSFTDTGKTTSISTADYLRNMKVLDCWLAQGGSR